MANLKDSGERRETETGAVRDRATGKGRMDLLPVDAILELAQHFEDGASKYHDRNWEKGMPLSWFLDSALRHTFKRLRGDTDEPHARAAMWNMACFIQTERWIEQGILPKSLNDLPTRNPDSAALEAYEKKAQEVYNQGNTSEVFGEAVYYPLDCSGPSGEVPIIPLETEDTQ